MVYVDGLHTVFILSIRTPQLLTILVLEFEQVQYLPDVVSKIAGWVANSVDPDETPRSAASHLGLHCFLRPVYPNTYGKYGKRAIKRDIFFWFL